MRKGMIKINSTELKSQLKKSGLNMKMVSERIGVSYVGLHRAFKVGRMGQATHDKILGLMGTASSSTRGDLSKASLEDLISALEARGWRVTISR